MKTDKAALKLNAKMQKPQNTLNPRIINPITNQDRRCLTAEIRCDQRSVVVGNVCKIASVKTAS